MRLRTHVKIASTERYLVSNATVVLGLVHAHTRARVQPESPVRPNVAVVYTGSSKKQAEHGGFAHDDTNVIMLVSNRHFEAGTVTTFVETTQVAPTILQALGLDPGSLDAVQKEGTRVLPGLDFK